LSSSYLLSLRALSAVILSTAARYRRTNINMSYVEFHRVTTSRGMSLSLRLASWQMRRQAGRAIVVELMIANESCRT
jgi:hypothetical protein